MCRLAASAYAPTGMGRPNGSSNWPARSWGPDGRVGSPTRDRPLWPWVISATRQRPAAIAAAACPTWITNDEPPTLVPSR